MKKPPIRDQRPPYIPVMKEDILDNLDTARMSVDQNGLFWIYTSVRRRDYICSRGVTHKLYWRTLWTQGTNDYVVCSHEAIV